MAMAVLARANLEAYVVTSNAAPARIVEAVLPIVVRADLPAVMGCAMEARIAQTALMTAADAVAVGMASVTMVRTAEVAHLIVAHARPAATASVTTERTAELVRRIVARVVRHAAMGTATTMRIAQAVQAIVGRARTVGTASVITGRIVAVARPIVEHVNPPVVLKIWSRLHL